MLYKWLFKPLLFRMDPEESHNLVAAFLALPGLKYVLGLFFSYSSPALRTTVAGIKFETPVGLAAGFDKNCKLIEVMPALGFGFMEVGTITAKEQPGNPKPRLFRLTKDNALINRMGFNNIGADKAALGLKKVEKNIPLGINIGKSKITPLEDAVSDYIYSFR